MCSIIAQLTTICAMALLPPLTDTRCAAHDPVLNTTQHNTRNIIVDWWCCCSMATAHNMPQLIFRGSSCSAANHSAYPEISTAKALPRNSFQSFPSQVGLRSSTSPDHASGDAPWGLHVSTCGCTNALGDKTSAKSMKGQHDRQEKY